MRNKHLLLLVLAVCVLLATSAWAQDPTFIRGDVTGDGVVDAADVTMLQAYVMGGTPMNCQLAGDVNDSPPIDMTDFFYLQSYVNSSGPPPPAPFPECGTDPTDPQAGTSCCEPAPPPEKAPSMTGYGILILILMLLVTGVWVYRKRQLNTA